MTLLNFEPSGSMPKGEKKSLKLFLGIGLLIGTVALGSTFAASINLNDSGPVEFGQGIAQTIACSGDENLTITPNATFTNAPGGGAFYFSSVKVSDIPSTCYGKDLTIRAYGNSGDTPLALFDEDATNVVVYNNEGAFEFESDITGASIISGDETFTINFTSPVALSTSVFSITIESGDHTSVIPVGVNWSPQLTVGTQGWESIASSSDGTKLVAGSALGFIWTSTDSGLNWTQQNSPMAVWRSVTSDSTGTKLAAALFGGSIYTSTNSGVDWTEQTLSGSRLWLSVTSSGDGTQLAAIPQSGYIYTSTDSGLNWEQVGPTGSRNWTSITYSSDGNTLVAGALNKIYISNNSGVDWTVQNFGGYWRSIASSSDGTKLAAADFWGYIHTSTDSGLNWIEQTSSTSGGWISITSSSDGNRLAAVKNNGHLYTSTDSGLTWTPRMTDMNRSWYSITSNSSGSKLAAVVNGEYIYTSSGS